MTPCNVIVGSLSDEDLTALKNEAIDELRRRLRSNIKLERYPKLTDLERFQFNRGQQLQAISMYERRTGLDAYIARKVITYYCLGMEP